MPSADLAVFVINLDRSPERLKQFLADNAIPGATIYRMPATDGKTLERADLVAQKLITDDLIYSNNAVACYLSHLRCWRAIVERNEPGVVCEDDVVMRRDLAEVHRKAGPMIAGADVVYWGFNRDMYLTYQVPDVGVCTSMLDHMDLRTGDSIEKFKLSTAPPNLYRVKRLFGACCYTVTPRGAEKLLKLVLPIRNGDARVEIPTGVGGTNTYTFGSLGVDMDLGLVHINQIDAYVAMPPVAFPRHDYEQSTIGTAFREGRVHDPSNA